MLNFRLVLLGLVFLVMGFSLVAAVDANFYLEIDSNKDGTVDSNPNIYVNQEFNILVKTTIDQHFPVKIFVFDLVPNPKSLIHFVGAAQISPFNSLVNSFLDPISGSWHYSASADSGQYGTGILLTTITAKALVAGDLTLSFDSLSANGFSPVTVSSTPKTLKILAPVAVCSIHSLSGCKTETECMNNGGYWYNHICNLKSECDLVSRLGCGVGKECLNGICVLPEPTCSLERLNLCLTEPACTSVKGYWYGGICNPTECNQASRLGCSAGKECVNGVCVLPLDTDKDGVPDAKDNCPLVKSTYQTDTDKDGMGDVCDLNDDNDNLDDEEDNCPLVANQDQADSNNNGIGDACESGINIDTDNDGFNNDVDCNPGDPNINPGALEICDGIDNNCNGKVDEGYYDKDNDNIKDCVDLDCKTDSLGCMCLNNADCLMGQSCQDSFCAMAVPVNDADGDGIIDDLDPDDDNDGVLDIVDNCPFDSNPNQADKNGNGFGNACDADLDGDGNYNALDSDIDGDGIPNPQDPDADDDGIPNELDLIPNGIGTLEDLDGDSIPNVNDNCPGMGNKDQQDTDKDGLGDVCDLDPDGDGLPVSQDNCPGANNPDQVDSDGDGVGDACDKCLNKFNPDQKDTDNDGVGDICDNCVDKPNSNQEDADGDSIGDACEGLPPPPGGEDGDGDGIINDLDKCKNTLAGAPVYDSKYPSDYWGCIKGDLSHDGKICFDDHTKYLTKFFQYFNKQIDNNDAEGLAADIKQDNTILFDDHTAYLTNFFKYFGCQ